MSVVLPVLVGLVAVFAPRARLAFGGALGCVVGLAIASLGPPSALAPGAWLAVLGSSTVKAAALVLAAEVLVEPKHKLAAVLAGAGTANLGAGLAAMLPPGAGGSLPFPAAGLGWGLTVVAATGVLVLARRAPPVEPAASSMGAAAGLLALAWPASLTFWAVLETMAVTTALADAPAWVLSVNMAAVVAGSAVAAVALGRLPGRRLRAAVTGGLALGLLLLLAGIVAFWFDVPRDDTQALVTQLAAGAAEVALHALPLALFVARCPTRFAALGVAVFTLSLSPSGAFANLPPLLAKLVTAGLGAGAVVGVGLLVAVRSLLAHLDAPPASAGSRAA